MRRFTRFLCTAEGNFLDETATAILTNPLFRLEICRSVSVAALGSRTGAFWSGIVVSFGPAGCLSGAGFVSRRGAVWWALTNWYNKRRGNRLIDFPSVKRCCISFFDFNLSVAGNLFSGIMQLSCAKLAIWVSCYPIRTDGLFRELFFLQALCVRFSWPYGFWIRACLRVFFWKVDKYVSWLSASKISKMLNCQKGLQKYNLKTRLTSPGINILFRFAGLSLS